MVVNEKALLRAMKASFKGKGYHVAVIGNLSAEWMLLQSGGWLVLLEAGNIPRKVLGYVAETTGALPLPGQAYRVSKDMTEMEQIDVLREALRTVEDRFTSAPSWKVKPTGLTMSGNELWQNCGTREMILMDPGLTDMIGDSRVAVTMAGDYLRAEGEISRIYLGRIRAAEGSAPFLEHLSKALWVTAD